MITGASSGLGEKLAHRFYDAGCKVVLTARRREDLERVKRNILISTNVSQILGITKINIKDLRKVSFLCVLKKIKK